MLSHADQRARLKENTCNKAISMTHLILSKRLSKYNQYYQIKSWFYSSTSGTKGMSTWTTSSSACRKFFPEIVPFVVTELSDCHQISKIPTLSMKVSGWWNVYSSKRISFSLRSKSSKGAFFLIDVCNQIFHFSCNS